MKVLIVDDSAETRSLIRVILENRGHTVAGEAEDGPGALKAFAELRPDVVLLDIIMPGKSGVEVLEEIRKIDPEAKVIMVTAVEQDRINRRLLLLGAAGIIYKPFSPAEFESSFHSALQLKPAAAVRSDAIKRLAAGGLSKCMLRASEASSWAWELCGVLVFSGKIPDAVRKADFGETVASIQVNVRDGSPFAAAMLFRSEDAGFISGCFVNGPLYRTDGVKLLEEAMLMEIGNVILNALANPLINALKGTAIASVPMFVKGGPAAVAAGLGACLDPRLDFRIIAASLSMRRDGRIARAMVLGVLPEELAAELDRAGAGRRRDEKKRGPLEGGAAGVSRGYPEPLEQGQVFREAEVQLQVGEGRRLERSEKVEGNLRGSVDLVPVIHPDEPGGIETAGESFAAPGQPRPGKHGGRGPPPALNKAYFPAVAVQDLQLPGSHVLQCRRVSREQPGVLRVQAPDGERDPGRFGAFARGQFLDSFQRQPVSAAVLD